VFEPWCVGVVGAVVELPSSRCVLEPVEFKRCFPQVQLMDALFVGEEGNVTDSIGRQYQQRCKKGEQPPGRKSPPKWLGSEIR
jgi:hypothetical protein